MAVFLVLGDNLLDGSSIISFWVTNPDLYRDSNTSILYLHSCLPLIVVNPIVLILYFKLMTFFSTNYNKGTLIKIVQLLN